jgi:hypothetical protein
LDTDLPGVNNAKDAAFAKRVDDGVLVYLARVSDKRRNLSAVSMWKYPPSTDVQKALQTAVDDPNARNERGHGGSVGEDGADFNQQARGSVNLPDDITRAPAIIGEWINASCDVSVSVTDPHPSVTDPGQSGTQKRTSGTHERDRGIWATRRMHNRSHPGEC